MAAMTGPLQGVRAIDLSRVLAGPTVTRLMAEFGAEVIKVEPPGGDPSRGLPYFKEGRSGYYIQQNRGKASVCVDFRHPEGVDVVRSLVRQADVLVENFRPGVLDDMGLGWDDLHELNPRLVLCSVSALGYGGPLSERPGYDTIGAAYAGIAHVSGPVGGPPMMPSAAIGDTTTGVHGFAGVVTALFNRERTGRGDWVQVSLLDTYVGCHEINIQAFDGSAGSIVPGPSGATHPTVCPAGMFACGDSWILIVCVSTDDWPRLTRAIGRPELGSEPRYATNEARVAHADEVIALIEGWLATCADVVQAVTVMEAHAVACAPVLSVSEAMDHPHNRTRRAVRTVPDERWGTITIPGVPIRMASAPEADLAARDLGADNDEVLRRVAGYSPEQIASLRDRGVLRSPAPGGQE
jgi:crotonobetainyl-CoA:carnitine CoA-transferase CaiB-like acyl-CoA transferase